MPPCLKAQTWQKQNNEHGNITVLTERSWSPCLSSPLTSAGPPAKMNDTNMPFPSSPPTMLKPSPEALFLKIIFLGSLKEQTKTTRLISHAYTNLLRLRSSRPCWNIEWLAFPNRHDYWQLAMVWLSLASSSLCLPLGFLPCFPGPRHLFFHLLVSKWLLC